MRASALVVPGLLGRVLRRAAGSLGSFRASGTSSGWPGTRRCTWAPARATTARRRRRCSPAAAARRASHRAAGRNEVGGCGSHAGGADGCCAAPPYTWTRWARSSALRVAGVRVAAVLLRRELLRVLRLLAVDRYRRSEIGLGDLGHFERWSPRPSTLITVGMCARDDAHRRVPAMRNSRIVGLQAARRAGSTAACPDLVEVLARSSAGGSAARPSTGPASVDDVRAAVDDDLMAALDQPRQRYLAAVFKAAGGRGDAALPRIAISSVSPASGGRAY